VSEPGKRKRRPEAAASLKDFTFQFFLPKAAECSLMPDNSLARRPRSFVAETQGGARLPEGLK
jgi:hypothetical protein